MGGLGSAQHGHFRQKLDVATGLFPDLCATSGNFTGYLGAATFSEFSLASISDSLLQAWQAKISPSGSMSCFRQVLNPNRAAVSSRSAAGRD